MEQLEEVFLSKDPQMVPNGIYIAKKFRGEHEEEAQYLGRYCKSIDLVEVPSHYRSSPGIVNNRNKLAVFYTKINDDENPQLHYFAENTSNPPMGYKFYKPANFDQLMELDAEQLAEDINLPKEMLQQIKSFTCEYTLPTPGGGYKPKRSRRKTKRYNPSRKRKTIRKRKYRKRRKSINKNKKKKSRMRR